MSATLDEIKDLLTQLKDDIIKQLSSRQISPKQIRTNMLSDISETLGLVKAGEFRSGNGSDPGKGFSGVRMGYPPFTYASALWNLVGIANDVLQFGLNADNGKAYFGGGAGIIDKFGVHVYDTNGKPSFVALSSAETVNGESLGAGDVLIGNNTVNTPNVLWKVSVPELQFRLGTNVYNRLNNGPVQTSGARTRCSTDQFIANNTPTKISFDTEDYDDTTFIDIAGSPTKITIPVGYAGRYRIGYFLAFANDATGTGRRFSYILLNGSVSLVGMTTRAVIGRILHNGSADVYLAEGDYLELEVYQDSGGSVAIEASSTYRPAMWIDRVR